MNKKRHINIIVVIAICVMLCCCVLVGAVASESISIYELMGQYFKEANQQDSMRAMASDGSLPLAEFHGQIICQKEVDYYNNMNNLTLMGTSNTQTTQESLTEILQNMVLSEEAERLGYAATQSEINAMLENSKLAYSIPEGKEMIEQYCEGANITVDEYFEYLEAQAPGVIARQKLLDAVGMEYCEENGLTFTKVNPPEELIEAKEGYIAELFAQAEDEITYYVDID